MSSVELESDHTILDACCVLTLYGSRRIRETLACIPAQVAVTEFVVAKEALKIYEGPEEDPKASKADLNLDPLVRDGLLRVVSLRDEEMESFIRLAQLVDDGEARTLAVAAQRGWAVASDDRKAVRLARKELDLSVRTTPQILKNWVDESEPSAEKVAAAIRNVEKRARYVPPNRHPLKEWWEKRRSAS